MFAAAAALDLSYHDLILLELGLQCGSGVVCFLLLV